MSPGTWVSLAFVVSATDQPIEQEQAGFELPLGWTMVVPPAPVSVAQGETQTLTLAVAVPENSPAGRHEIVMVLGHQSVSAVVEVAAIFSLEWLADEVTTQPHPWWPDRPWVGQVSLVLIGNQSLEISVVGRASPGVVVNLSPNPQQISPGVPMDIAIEVHRHPDHQQPLPKHLPIAIEVFGANELSPLLSKRWLLMPVATDKGQSAQRPWRLGGFVDWHSGPRERRGGRARPSQWGIEGSGHWDPSNDRALSFAWHKDARWGRYVGFAGHHIRWRVGHQVFLGERLDGLARLGRGLRATWQRDQAPDAWRVGWIQFYGQDGHGHGKSGGAHHYISPWWSWRGWRVAYIDAAASQASDEKKQAAWSLSYQTSTESLRQQAPGLNHWRVHVTGHRGAIAGQFDYQHRDSDQIRWDIMAESIPTDHFSDVPTGTRLRLRLHHRFGHDASLQTALLASHESSPSKASYRRYQWKTQYWRSVNGSWGLTLDDLRLGLGATYRHDQAWRRDPSRTQATDKQSTHRSDLSVRLRARTGNWHFSGRLDTQGRLALASHGLQSGVGRWRFGWQNRVRSISLESVSSGSWGWSLSWVRQTHRVSSHHLWTERWIGAKAIPTGQSSWQLGLVRRMRRGQEWSATLTASRSDQQPIMLWLRYRWQSDLPSPVPMIQRLIGYHPGYRIAGCAHQITAAGPTPVVGALVWLNETSTLTDRDGCYRFMGIAPGPYRLAIEPVLPPSRRSGARPTTPSLNNRQWLLTTSDHVDLWLDAGSSSAQALSYDDHNLQELIHDWSWIQPARLVVSLKWPDESPLDETDREAVLNELRLVGTCSACPRAHQRRTAKRNADGQWVVEQLLPGDWRWQWAGGLLPSEHEWVEPHQSLSLKPGQTLTLVWALGYRPQSIEWQRSQVVELSP